MAAAGAAAAALAATAAAPASAGVPVGEQLATGALQQPVIDHDSGRIGYVVAPRTVRVIDADGRTTRDVAIPDDCAQPAHGTTLTGAGEGKLLLACQVTETFDIGTGRTFTRSWVAPYLIDEPSGAVTPAGDPAKPTWGTAIAVTRAGVVVAVPANGRDPAYQYRLDPVNGAIVPGSADYVPPAHGIALRSTRGLPNTMPLTASFDACRTTLTWTVGTLTQAWALNGGALLLSEAAYGEAPLTLTRVALGDPCARTATGWTLRASTRGRTVTTLARTAAVPDASTGAVAGLAASRAAAPRLRALRGGRLRLRSSSALDGLRWRVAGGRWHATRGTGRSWTARLPAGLRGTRAVELETRLHGGGSVRHALRLTVVRR